MLKCAKEKQQEARTFHQQCRYMYESLFLLIHMQQVQGERTFYSIHYNYARCQNRPGEEDLPYQRFGVFFTARCFFPILLENEKNNLSVFNMVLQTHVSRNLVQANTAFGKYLMILKSALLCQVKTSDLKHGDALVRGSKPRRYSHQFYCQKMKLSMFFELQ